MIGNIVGKISAWCKERNFFKVILVNSIFVKIQYWKLSSLKLKLYIRVRIENVADSDHKLLLFHKLGLKTKFNFFWSINFSWSNNYYKFFLLCNKASYFYYFWSILMHYKDSWITLCNFCWAFIEFHQKWALRFVLTYARSLLLACFLYSNLTSSQQWLVFH